MIYFMETNHKMSSVNNVASCLLLLARLPAEYMCYSLGPSVLCLAEASVSNVKKRKERKRKEDAWLLGAPHGHQCHDHIALQNVLQDMVAFLRFWVYCDVYVPNHAFLGLCANASISISHKIYEQSSTHDSVAVHQLCPRSMDLWMFWVWRK